MKAKAKVTSIIRTEEHASDITAASATPLVLSLENDSVEKFTNAFEGSDVVVFSAGAGGQGSADRTKAVDYEGALKVYDAIEAVKGEKPRLLLVSAVDVRNPDIIPDYYVGFLFADMPSGDVLITSGPERRRQEDFRMESNSSRHLLQVEISG